MNDNNLGENQNENEHDLNAININNNQNNINQNQINNQDNNILKEEIKKIIKFYQKNIF